jgi:hypothetical protein
MGPPPQSRPARTLVLTFMVAPLNDTKTGARPTARATGTELGIRLLVGCYGVSITTGPQSRPARTLVLIFIVAPLNQAEMTSGRPHSRPAQTLAFSFLVALP